MITIYLKQFNKIVRNADVKLFDELGYDDILWIDMLTPSIKEQKAVENFMEINLQTQQQVEEIESSSKYSETENAIICNSNFFMPYTETFAIEPVSFIIAEGVLVSVRNAEFRTFTEAAKRLQMNYRAYATGYHVLVSILEVRIDYDADLVEALAKNIAALSKEVNISEQIGRETLQRISHLQENTMLIRENIFDRQRVLSGIQRSERFPNDVYPRLTLMIKDVNSLISHADFSSERLDYLQDTALGLINIEQSNVTKIFTVAALFFMPPTMIASIYGMNFAYIQELHWKYGYPFALGRLRAHVPVLPLEKVAVTPPPREFAPWTMNVCGYPQRSRVSAGTGRAGVADPSSAGCRLRNVPGRPETICPPKAGICGLGAEKMRILRGLVAWF